jgi:hypothetical protein
MYCADDGGARPGDKIVKDVHRPLGCQFTKVPRVEPPDPDDVPLASIAKQVWAGRRRPAEFFDAFNRERIFAQRPASACASR